MYIISAMVLLLTSTAPCHWRHWMVESFVTTRYPSASLSHVVEMIPPPRCVIIRVHATKDDNDAEDQDLDSEKKSATTAFAVPETELDKDLTTEDERTVVSVVRRAGPSVAFVTSVLP